MARQGLAKLTTRFARDEHCKLFLNDIYAVSAIDGLGTMRAFLKSIPQLRRLRYRLMQLKHGTKSEADEADILTDLAATTAAPKTFVEFGFHPVKFNCAAFANEPEWRGS
ncbi:MULTISPECIES: hypothetical protein [unclassified Bradyrhizobium]|uniref:hypothetical protein n=1 Tax=unclassified Bradyrhizobium TaxID=2631580 RepID=UPI001FF93753|nr:MULTISPECIES: hypothetical protein [unclassified Bradyrhizobium]